MFQVVQLCELTDGLAMLSLGFGYGISTMAVCIPELPENPELLVDHVDDGGGPSEAIVFLGGCSAQVVLLYLVPFPGEAAFEELVPANGLLGICQPL